MSQEEILGFIDDYRKLSVLWDQNNKEYTNKTKRNDALKVLSENYKISVDSVKKKIKSLRSYFSKEHQKAIKKKSGTSAVDKYNSSWFAYKPLLFILDSITPRQAKESGENRNQDDLEPYKSSDILQSTDLLNIPETTALTNNECEFLHLNKTKRNITRTKTSKYKKEEEDYGLLNRASDCIANKDEYSIFGQLVATKIRKLNPRNRLIAQQRINTVFFDLEMQEMNTKICQSYIVPSPVSSAAEGNTDDYCDNCSVEFIIPNLQKPTDSQKVNS